MKTMTVKVLNLSILSIFAFLSINANAQVKVGNNPTTITSSSVLDIESTNKGVLFPRIALTSTTDQTTIASPAAGLMVYNTGGGTLTYKGYVFWDGSVWKKLDGSDIPDAGSNIGDATITSSATVGPLLTTNEQLKDASGNAASGYHRVVTSADGKFSVRVKLEKGYQFQQSDLQIRSNDGSKTIMWSAQIGFVYGNTGDHYFQGSNVLLLPNGGTWYGNGVVSGGANAAPNSDVATTDFGAAWANEDVYYYSPEFRRYTWTSTDTNDKTVYILSFSMGAPTFTTVANDVSCPSGNCPGTKAFLRIEQINAN